MAEEAKEAGQSGTWLSRTFNNAVKHIFSPTMLFMMAAMAFPMIAGAATTAGTTATLGDLALGTVDMYWEMIKAPFTNGGVVVDALSNAANGDIAANAYEMGMADHGNMMNGAMAMDHGGGLAELFGNMSVEDFEATKQAAESLNMSHADYLQQYNH